MLVNYYYSDELTNDTEGNLIQLCRACAKAHREVIQFAQTGDPESSCEMCKAQNEPGWDAHPEPEPTPSYYLGNHHENQVYTGGK